MESHHVGVGFDTFAQHLLCASMCICLLYSATGPIQLGASLRVTRSNVIFNSVEKAMGETLEGVFILYVLSTDVRQPPYPSCRSRQYCIGFHTRNPVGWRRNSPFFFTVLEFRAWRMPTSHKQYHTSVTFMILVSHHRRVFLQNMR